MLRDQLDDLKELNNNEDIYKLPDAYDDFAIGVVVINNQFYVVYDPNAIVEDLIENAGLDCEQAEANFTATIGTESNVAWLAKELNVEESDVSDD